MLQAVGSGDRVPRLRSDSLASLAQPCLGIELAARATMAQFRLNFAARDLDSNVREPAHHADHPTCSHRYSLNVNSDTTLVVQVTVNHAPNDAR